MHRRASLATFLKQAMLRPNFAKRRVGQSSKTELPAPPCSPFIPRPTQGPTQDRPEDNTKYCTYLWGMVLLPVGATGGSRGLREAMHCGKEHLPSTREVGCMYACVRHDGPTASQREKIKASGLPFFVPPRRQKLWNQVSQ